METSRSANALIPNKQPLPSSTVVSSNEKVAMKNQTLDRESKGCYNVCLYTSVFIFLDVWRQVTSYGMIYYNDYRYPVAPTEIIAVTEIIKLVLFLWQLFREDTLMQVKISLLYFIPSLIHALNNNIYFLAMHYTTPPIWNLLIQLRVIFTTLIYRFIFGRKLSVIQWIALCILIIAVILPKLGEFSGNLSPVAQRFSISLIAITLAVVASLLAAIGSLYTEVNSMNFTCFY